MIYEAIQHIRRLLGLTHDVVDRANAGSGSVTVIPEAGPRTLEAVAKHEAYRKYDPVPYVPSDIPWGVGKVTNRFNQVCSAVGLQGAVQMDATDWKTIYNFKNVSRDKLIRIRWQTGKQNQEILLEPNESATIKVDHSLDSGMMYPEIKAFQYECD